MSELRTAPAAPLARPRPLPLPLAAAGRAADAAAARHVVRRYRERLAANTRRRQDGDLARFAAYLADVGTAAPGDLAGDPAAWAGVTWGLVEGFVRWMLEAGDAIGSVNIRLSTVKTYARLAAQGGALSGEAYALIRLVPGYRPRAGRQVDAQRPRTRRGAKKAQSPALSALQVQQLLAQPDAYGRLLMALLLDHGLRVGEVALLEVKHVDLAAGILTVRRPKVDLVQRHRLSPGACAAAAELLPTCPDGRLFPSERAIRAWVRVRGRRVGLPALAPHDLRHVWATRAGRRTPTRALQDAGGWASPAMALRYQESAAVANDGVILD